MLFFLQITKRLTLSIWCSRQWHLLYGNNKHDNIAQTKPDVTIQKKKIAGLHWYVSICGTLIEYSIILETIHNWLFDHVQFSNRCLLVYEHQLQEISNAWHGSLNFRRYFDVLLFVLEYIKHYFGLLRKKSVTFRYYSNENI